MPAPPPSKPSEEEAVRDTSVDGERASLLHAAANARTAATLTGTHGVVAPPLDRAAIDLPAPLDLLPDGFLWEEHEGETEGAALLRARAASLGGEESGDDAVGRLRAHLALAYAKLDDGQHDAARASAALAAASVDHAPAAHALLRILAAGREPAAIDEQLAHVEHITAHVSDALVRADFLTEEARLREASSGASAASIAAYGAALALMPDHAGALAGLEAALEATERWAELAALLGRLAGLAGEPAASAWLHVERALIFDRRLGDAGTARAALDHAVELAPGIGPVREAAVDHATVHRDDARLATLLEAEAALETDRARATCLELDGALAYLRAGDPARATKLLEHAHDRPRSSKVVDARVADELARLLEKAGRHADALRVRKAALGMVSDSRAELLGLRAVVAAAERAGELSDAVLALERARVLDADDATILEELDRLLAGAGRHEARAVLWTREAALADDARAKARAMLIAADASAAAGRAAEAARHREAAWAADPSAPGVFDALAERLSAASSPASVTPRVALYEKAAERTADIGRKLHYLEKIAWLWDDVAGDAALAAQAYEAVLAVDPKRRSAIAGLASSATRARDGRKLARALLAEAEVTEDALARAEVRLRAAEALAEVEPERSLALAEDLAKGEHASTAMGARELVTRLHATAGRWELVARSLSDRANAEKKPAAKLTLALAKAAVQAQRLLAPDQALATLEAARADTPGDPAIAAAIASALEGLGDAEALRAKHEELASDATDPEARVSHLLRAAEIAELRASGDEAAVGLYIRAREALPGERLVIERLRRLGARVDVPADVVPPRLAALRSLDAGRKTNGVSAETLLADGTRDFAALRQAERLARRSRSAPQLANALALAAEVTSGVLAIRALSALAALVAWSLPEGTDLAPWDRLVTLGSRDAVVLDDFVRRAAPQVREGDRGVIGLACEATRRRLEAAADDTERVVMLVVLARMQRRAGLMREAVASCRLALAIDPSSVAAAVVLNALATELGDRNGAVTAAAALAEVTRSAPAKARLLRDAADLSVAEGDPTGAAALLERALEADPEAILVAARLAQIQAKQGAWADLARALRRGLREARTAEAVVPMAAELADVAKNRLHDPVLAIDALERSRVVSPGHVPALFLLAELYIGQRTWDEALRALADVVVHATEPGEKLIALCGRASILARVLARSEEAEKELRAALVIEPHDPRALRALLALPITLTTEERVELLSRLVVAGTPPEERRAALLELARLRRELGDAGGSEGALVEAAALLPDAAMLERLHTAAAGDAETEARVLGRALARARDSGTAPGAVWLANLGELELGLGRFDAAVEHFEEALGLEPSRERTRLALARALAAKGRHDKAAAALMPLLDASTAGLLDVTFVRQLDAAFAGAGRTQQALVARELRALAGDLDQAGTAALASRRPSYATNKEAMSASVLRSFVMPGAIGKHPIWDVAALTTGIAGKLARIGLVEQGSSTKDRVKPKAVHPVRQLFDRLTQVFELVDVELAVSDHVTAPVVACEDATWVIAPSSLADWSEPHALAALARPMVRIALGIPWFGALPADETLAILVVLARQSVPSFNATPHDLIESLTPDYELRARRAIDRKKRKALEELEPELTRAPTISVDAFTDAVLRTEIRAAFLLSGDLRASLEAISVTESGLGDALRLPGRVALTAVLSRPIARDLVAFGLGGDAHALRRGMGASVQ